MQIKINILGFMLYYMINLESLLSGNTNNLYIFLVKEVNKRHLLLNTLCI